MQKNEVIDPVTMNLYTSALFSAFLLSSCVHSEQQVTTIKPEIEGDNNWAKAPSIHAMTDTVAMVPITKGSYAPLYGTIGTSIEVDEFRMDVHPVTNRQYGAFVKANPQWQRSQVKAIYAESNYLCNWLNDTTLTAGQMWDAPVTNVSWFAANAYCKCMGKQLPTVDQWEYVAMADERERDARSGKSFNQRIIGWYEKPKTYNTPVQQTFKNYWGVWDMHDLVWEWTKDFNEVMISSESGGDTRDDENRFCGSGSIGASNLMDYAAFMRYAFRGSLKANYCIRNQGFRCVKSNQ